MLTIINKLTVLSNTIFEVVPQERMKKWANKILVKPTNQAYKKLEISDSAENMAARINTFIDSLSPTTLSTFAFAALTHSPENPNAKDLISKLMELDTASEELKNTIIKIANVIERNSNHLGKIVEKILLISYDSKNEFLKQEEEEITEETEKCIENTEE